MNPQERKLIDDLAGKLAQTQLGQKDAEAESLIRQEIGALPDSLYMLVQTVLVQNLALDQAKAQIGDLQQRVASAQAQPAAPTSFLGSLFGGGSHSNPPPPPRPAPPPGYSAPAQGYGAPPPGYGAPAQGYAAPPPGYGAPPPGYGAPPAAPGGGSSFLRSAATTAAGVAAGALAFEGISSLMHGGMGGGFGGGGLGHQGGSGFMDTAGHPGETIVNNYYDSPPDASSDTTDKADGTADNLVADNTDQNDADDSTGYQDTSTDDNSYDDSGSDDSGGGGDDLV